MCQIEWILTCRCWVPASCDKTRRVVMQLKRPNINCIAPLRENLTPEALWYRSHSFYLAKHHTRLSPRKHSPEGATMVATIWLQLTTHLSTPKSERMKSWVDLVSWPTADGLPINGYSSAAGQLVQARESSPLRDWRSTTELSTNRTVT